MNNAFKWPSMLRGLDFSKEEISNARKANRLLRIGLELTKACNLQCIYCYANSGKPLANELSLDELKSVITEAVGLGAKGIVLIGGGEPLLYPELFDLIDFINSKNCIPIMFTNATLLNEKTAKKLFEKNVSVITKLNSLSNSKIQDTLNGQKGSFGRMKRGLKLLMKAGFNKTTPTRLGLESVITRLNYDEIPAIWEFCRENNIFPYIELIKKQGRASNSNVSISKEEAKNLFEKISELDRKKFGFVWQPVPPLLGWRCKQHFMSCYVTADGIVQPCSVVSLAVGDVRKENLKEIISKDLFQKIRCMGKHIMGKCGKCRLFDSCYGCRGNAFQIYGSMFAEDPYCWH